MKSHTHTRGREEGRKLGGKEGGREGGKEGGREGGKEGRRKGGKEGSRELESKDGSERDGMRYNSLHSELQQMISNSV